MHPYAARTEGTTGVEHHDADLRTEEQRVEQRRATCSEGACPRRAARSDRAYTGQRISAPAHGPRRIYAGGQRASEWKFLLCAQFAAHLRGAVRSADRMGWTETARPPRTGRHGTFCLHGIEPPTAAHKVRAAFTTKAGTGMRSRHAQAHGELPYGEAAWGQATNGRPPEPDGTGRDRRCS